MVSQTWRPIADLPTDWAGLARPDLGELLRQWQQECQFAADPERVRQHAERLAAIWAIEAGIVGRLYSLGRDTVDALGQAGPRAVERLRLAGGIADDTARLIANQRAAFDLASSYAHSHRPLSLPFVRELHQLLTRSQTQSDTVGPRGASLQAKTRRELWDRVPNAPMAFDHPLREDGRRDGVGDDADRLIEMHQRHLALGVAPEIEAAWLHHRVTYLCPFQATDGRLAHLLATIVFLRAGCVPLVMRDDAHRHAYADALSEADAGDLKPLVDLFANVVSGDLNEAITIVRAARGRDIGAIAAAAANAAKRYVVHDERSLRLLTDHYRKLAGTKLRDVAGQLTRAFVEAIPGLPSELHAWIVSDDLEIKMATGARGRWREQIVHAGSVYRYSPDLGQYKRWVAVKLPGATADAQRWQVVVSLHHKESRAGVMAVVLFLTTSDASDGGAAAADVARPSILGARREFTYSGGPPQDDRFLAWLELSLTSALEEWQARI